MSELEHRVEQVDPIELVMQAAEGAMIAYEGIQRATQLRDAAEILASSGVEGATINQDARDRIENELRKSQRDFELLSGIVNVVFPAQGETPVETEAESQALEQAGQPSSAEKSDIFERDISLLKHVLLSADRDGVYRSPNIREAAMEATGMSRDQWKSSLRRLRAGGYVTTGRDGRDIVEATAHGGQIESAITEGIIPPFNDEEVARKLAEVRQHEVATGDPGSSAGGQSPDSNPSSVPTPSSQEGTDSTDLLPGERRKLVRERHNNILLYALEHGDEHGVYESYRLRQEIKGTYDLSENQWKSSLAELRALDCITTEKDGNNIVKMTVHIDKIEAAVANDRLSPFDNGKSATQVLEQRRRELAGEETEEAVQPAHEQPADTNPKVETGETEPAGSSPPGEVVRSASRDEKVKLSRDQNSELLHQLLKRVDADGAYQDEDIEGVLKTSLELSDDQLERILHRLEGLKCVSIARDDDGEMIRVSLNTRVIDNAIISRKVTLFPDGKTSEQIMRTRRLELERDSLEAEEAGDGGTSDNSSPAATSTVSPRVRRAIERDEAESSQEPVFDDLEGLERAIAEIRAEVMELDPTLYDKLPDAAIVAVAYTDPTMQDGFTNAAAVMEELQILTMRPVEIVKEGHDYLTSNNLLRATQELGRLKLSLNAAGLHFLRNMIERIKSAA